MKNKKHTPLLAALATLVVLLAGVVLIWLAKVRPDVGKGRSEIVTDFLRAELLQDGQTATQVFTYDKDILTIGLEFYLPGDQPCGALDVVLYDADTGEELSRSVGTMDYIVPDQYTTLGMDPAVTGQEGRRYKLAVTPHYATDAILAIGHSDGVALWKEQMAVDDRVIDGTMAMQITYQRIGGYLTRFFLLVGVLAAVLAALAVWAVLSKKLALHRLVFVLVLGFGLLYSFVLPPYAAPDEKYHINQSFTLACRWANDLSHDEWRMGKVPTTTSFRRVGDEDADLQNENTTVFTWEAFTSQLFTTTDQPFDSHQEYNELQTDQNPLLYVVSAAAVFLAYVLHFGFAPALFLGRLANLLLFAALAALAAKRHSPESDPLMLVLAADHVIADEDAFRAAVRNAMPYAEAGKLVTFGIVPDLPETGYGYIRRGEVSAGEQDTVAFEVAQFVEKPNLETAQAYVASGEYYWNSGMFLFRAGCYLEELKKYRPDILDACEKAMSAVDPDLDFIRVDEEAFLACPEESVDYAVMERTADAVVVPMDAGWSDVGSWSSLWEISAHTAEGNVCHGDVINHKTENSYVYAESGLVTTVGVKDLVVVQTKDAVLIADRNAVQDVKKVVEQIKADGRHEHRVHREVYRPWGKYDSIDAGDRYQVKRITVKPGEGLSVQMHHHRAEHWVVVAGTAKVTIDGDIKLLGENESIYIPLGATHCLENPGKIPLDLIEVRSGSYLEEDDVVRFADRYGRV